MAEPLQIDDAVTVVSKTDRAFTLVKHVQWVDMACRTGFVAAVDLNSTQFLYSYDQEGMIWIRGAHPPKSREVQALLAAHALVRG